MQKMDLILQYRERPHMALAAKVPCGVQDGVTYDNESKLGKM